MVRHLSGKEKKQLKSLLPKGYDVDKKDEIVEKESVLFKNDTPLLIIKDKQYLPHMKSVNEDDYPCAYIDKGAIPFLLKGADMMRPGIQKIEGDFEENDIILIKDENHNKILGIGFALLDSKEMQKQEKGKSIAVYHFFNDEYY